MISVASSRRRSLRQLGNYVNGLDRRVRRMGRRPSPRRVAARSVESSQIVEGAVTTAILSPAVVATIDDAQTTADDAQTTADDAQTTADGKNKIYRQTTAPPGSSYATGDLWFDTDDGNKFYRWTGAAWDGFTLGDSAIASISASKITAGTIDASVITVSNLNAGNITTGTLTGRAINNGTGTFTVDSSGVMTATAGYIGSWAISGGNLVGTTSTIPTIMDSNGNIQFGNNLDVGGRVTGYRSAEDALYATNGGITVATTARIRGMGIAYEGTSGPGSANYIGLKWDNPDIVGTVDNAVSTVLGTVSDIRFKTDIQDLDDVCVAKILDRVTVVEYSPVDLLNNGEVSSIRKVGIVAQHLLEIMPELVNYDASNPDAYLSTNYLGFVPHLVKVVQHLNDRIKVLESLTP